MNKINDSRCKAINDLIDNVNSQNYLPTDGSPAYLITKGKKIFMPAYIPYVGPKYFNYQPRILCYAINQNLSRHRSWSNRWMQEWSADIDCAINRLNHAASCNRALPIKPYAEGFMPLATILCLLSIIRRKNCKLPKTIDKVISVTNFVKFSTSDNASSSGIPETWWQECGFRYVSQEIDILKPDIIVAFGKKTFMEIKKVISSNNSNKGKIKLLECRFPGRIPSEKARPVHGRDKQIWDQYILPLTARINAPSDSFFTWRMTRFPGYFVDIARTLESLYN